MAMVLAAGMLGCGGGGDDDDEGSPFPDVAVTGVVMDVRGVPVEGALVAVANGYDSASTDTDLDGAFSLVVDGSTAPSSIDIHHADYRLFDGSTRIEGTSTDTGTWPVVSNEEIVFTTMAPTADVYMIRADGAGDLLQLSDSPGLAETCPRRLESGLMVRWVNTEQSAIYEARWDGSDSFALWVATVGYRITGFAWADRGTFIAETEVATDRAFIEIAEDPPGDTYDYDWRGAYPDLSPASFGFIGPEPIDGNMLVFAGNHDGDAGLMTAFPYFTNMHLVPEWIDGTEALDLYPRWSAHRSDNTLDIAFQRDYGLYVSHVSAGDTTNEYSAPVQFYGDDVDDVNANRFAWSPSVDGARDRIAIVVNAFSSGSSSADPGDIVIVEYDHATSSVVGDPILLYDADTPGNPGMALGIDWR
jgi:hypothetical protein